MPFGWKIWVDPGKTGCSNCGSKNGPLASPGFLSGQLWCVKCLKRAGKL